LLGGTPLAVFDNISRRLDSPVLSAALTGLTWSDRVLGVSKMVRVPIRITWVLTGNNMSFSREMTRRTVHVRLDAKTPDPHLRAGFKHDPILAWVRDHRGLLVWAALVLVQHWIAGGRRPGTDARLGSYESWAETVGGIPASAGIQGFLANRAAFAAVADAESAEWTRFVADWWESFGADPVEMGALFPLAGSRLPDVLGDGADRSQRTRLGKALAKRIGWMFTFTPADQPGHPAEARIEAAGEVLDQEGRQRNAWALAVSSRWPAPEKRNDVGTLGNPSVSSRNGDASGLPNVPPNVPPTSPAPWDIGERWGNVGADVGEQQVADSVDSSGVVPNVPNPFRRRPRRGTPKPLQHAMVPQRRRLTWRTATPRFCQALTPLPPSGVPGVEGTGALSLLADRVPRERHHPAPRGERAAAPSRRQVPAPSRAATQGQCAGRPGQCSCAKPATHAGARSRGARKVPPAPARPRRRGGLPRGQARRGPRPHRHAQAAAHRAVPTRAHRQARPRHAHRPLAGDVVVSCLAGRKARPTAGRTHRRSLRAEGGREAGA
jgi:hypothetical protein